MSDKFDSRTVAVTAGAAVAILCPVRKSPGIVGVQHSAGARMGVRQDGTAIASLADNGVAPIAGVGMMHVARLVDSGDTTYPWAVELQVMADADGDVVVWTDTVDARDEYVGGLGAPGGASTGAVNATVTATDATPLVVRPAKPGGALTVDARVASNETVNLAAGLMKFSMVVVEGTATLNGETLPKGAVVDLGVPGFSLPALTLVVPAAGQVLFDTQVAA